ncbi:MAG: hypothetical protein AB1766_09340, partial [Pseudomonadota bacterium]
AVVLFGHPQGLAFGAGLDVDEAVKPVVRVFGVPFPVVYPKQVQFCFFNWLDGRLCQELRCICRLSF